MRYTYRCTAPEAHVFEESHLMDEFLANSPTNPRHSVCSCGSSAYQIIRPQNLHFSMGNGAAGFNVAAGAYHKNAYETLEWMKRSEEVVTDPLTGKERVNRPEPICPEQVWAEKAYLKDVKEAALDRAPPPVHPAEKRREERLREAVKTRVRERINAAPREFGAMLNKEEYPREVLEARQQRQGPPAHVPA